MVLLDNLVFLDGLVLEMDIASGFSGIFAEVKFSSHTIFQRPEI